MRSIINKLIAGTLTVASAACTGDYMDINSNPYQPGDLSADDYALGSAMNNLASCVVSSDVNTAQFTDCLLGGPMGGYFADANTNWSETIANYNAVDGWTNVFLKSDRIIPVLYTNLTAVNNISEAANNPVPSAIAKIIKVAAMSRVTDAYGPIPYSQIGEDGKVETPYDSQEAVYDAFFTELTDAVTVLQDNPGAALTASADYVYSGDITKWIKFANSLKLRLAMRLAYVDRSKAQQWAENATDAANGGVIESNEDNAQWNYFATNTNPIYTAKEYNAPTGTSNGGDSHAAADIICYMNGYNDPRREKYFTTSEWDGIDYIGIRRGIDLSSLGSNARKYSGIGIQTHDPIYWLNAAEVAFLRAEAKAVFNFSNVGGQTAQQYYEDGVRLSFEQWGVSGVDTYLADDTSMPTAYSDPSGANNYASQLATITIKWDESASTEVKQERIITQKWIANWTIGNEAWADRRRTGYPHLMPNTEAGNKSAGVVDSQEGAKRIPYPVDEYVSNAANIQQAVSTLLGGPDNYATKVWWDKK